MCAALHAHEPVTPPCPLPRSAWLAWGAIQCAALLADRLLQVRHGEGHETAAEGGTACICLCPCPAAGM